VEDKVERSIYLVFLVFLLRDGDVPCPFHFSLCLDERYSWNGIVVRGAGGDVILCEEAAFIPREMWHGIILPLVSMAVAALICISTMQGKANLYSVMMKKIDVRTGTHAKVKSLHFRDPVSRSETLLFLGVYHESLRRLQSPKIGTVHSCRRTATAMARW